MGLSSRSMAAPEDKHHRHRLPHDGRRDPRGQETVNQVDAGTYSDDHQRTSLHSRHSRLSSGSVAKKKCLCGIKRKCIFILIICAAGCSLLYFSWKISHIPLAESGLRRMHLQNQIMKTFDSKRMITNFDTPKHFKAFWDAIETKDPKSLQCLGFIPLKSSCRNVNQRISKKQHCSKVINRHSRGYCEFNASSSGQILRYQIGEDCTPMPEDFRCAELYQTLSSEDMINVDSVDELQSLWNSPEFVCVGWKGTQDCAPDGKRDPYQDKPCDRTTYSWSAGYCEFRNTTSNQRYRVLRRGCENMYGEVRCKDLLPLVDTQNVKDLTDPRKLKQKLSTGELSCVGWRATNYCDPDGPRKITGDRGCSEMITDVEGSGYCLFRDALSNNTMRVKVKGRFGCEGELGDFACDTLDQYLDPDILRLSNVSELRQHHKRLPNGMRCAAWKGMNRRKHNSQILTPNHFREGAGRHAAKQDALCSAYLPKESYGYCQYFAMNDNSNKAWHQQYHFYPGKADRAQGLFRCLDFLEEPSHGNKEGEEGVFVELFHREEFVKLWNSKEEEISCIGFRAQDDNWMRMAKWDRTCDKSFQNFEKGFCEFKVTSITSAGPSRHFRLYNNNTGWRHPLRCDNAFEWFGQTFITISTWQETVDVIEEGAQCLGWRSTANCDPLGERTPNEDRNCSSKLSRFQSGFCEYVDLSTGTRYALLQSDCHTYADSFRCSYIPHMVKFSALLKKTVTAWKHTIPPPVSYWELFRKTGGPGQRGIVICVHDKIWINAFALLNLLKEHGVKLPIEIWHMPNELLDYSEEREILRQDLQITFRKASGKGGFMIKIYAILHTRFDEVLLLDSDNYPVRDPTFLFKSLEYMRHGAIFWPDFWKGKDTVFSDLESNSLFWSFLGIKKSTRQSQGGKSTFEQESGQILIDKRRCAGPLSVLRFFLDNHEKALQPFMWGDKDLFRFAWMVYGQTFFMIPKPPGTAGLVDRTSHKYCGRTMVQHDPSGDILFLHRNMAKFSEENGRRSLWKYVQQFTGDTVDEYHVLNDPPGSACYALAGPQIRVSSLRTLQMPSAHALSTLESFLLEQVRAGYTLLCRRRPGRCGISTRALETLKRELEVLSNLRVSASDGESEMREREEELSISNAQQNFHPELIAARPWQLSLGYMMMRELQATVAILITSEDHVLALTLQHVEDMCKFFSDCKVVLIDAIPQGTRRSFLHTWIEDNTHAQLIESNLTRHLKNEDIVRLQNFVLKRLAGDYLLWVDSDLTLGWEMDGIAHSFSLLGEHFGQDLFDYVELEEFYSPWDVICSNAVVRTRRYAYGKVDFKDGLANNVTMPDELLRHVRFDVTTPPFAVQSCHGGLSMYKIMSIGKCRYRTPSHSSMQECMKAEGKRVVFNPKLLSFARDTQPKIEN